METLEKYCWLKKIDKALLSLDATPLIRTYAPFDFEKFASLIQKKFSLNSVKIQSSELKWQTKDEIKSTFSANVNYLSFLFSPLPGNVYLLIDLEDIAKITNELLIPDQIQFSSTMLQESYFRFLVLEALNTLTEMNLFQDLSSKIVESPSILSENALCLDINIKLNEINCFCKIAITPEFRQAWENYFINNPPLKAVEMSKALELHLTAELGYVKLKSDQLKNLKIGDFIILDEIDYDPKTNKGKIILKLADIALFLAKIKQNKIKIVDFANYYKEPSMPESNLEKEEEEKIQVEEAQEIPLAELENVEVNVVVEAARFKMTLDKLMNLQPGNILDLAVHPEAGVNLVVNNKKIAKAELVNLGEILGVRILEIG